MSKQKQQKNPLPQIRIPGSRNFEDLKKAAVANKVKKDAVEKLSKS